MLYPHHNPLTPGAGVRDTLPRLWRNSYSTSSGLPQAYPLSALNHSAAAWNPMSLRRQQRLARLKSAAISIAQAIWRWL